MKIITGGTEYPCDGFSPGAGTLRYNLPDTQPETLGETMELQADTGASLRIDTVANYARNTIDGTVLVLTNEPEPVPVEQPAPTATVQDNMLEMLVDHECRMTMMELGVTDNGSN